MQLLGRMAGTSQGILTICRLSSETVGPQQVDMVLL